LERTLHATTVDSPAYLAAKEDMRVTAGQNGLDWVFDYYNLDALFMVREGHHSLANMVGHPIGMRLSSSVCFWDTHKPFSGTVPLGVMSDGVPIGAFFIGRKDGDDTLLSIM
jgi:amidase